MKNIKTYDKWILEVVDGKKEDIHCFKDPKSEFYQIKTKKSSYDVLFKSKCENEKNIVEIVFDDRTRKFLTGYNEFLDLLNGLLEVSLDYVETYKPDILWFEGMYEDDEEQTGSSKRSRIYKYVVDKFLKDHYPKSTYKEVDNIITIYLKYN